MILRALEYVSDIANRITEFALVVLAAFFTLLLITSVSSRYVFDLSIVTSVELTRIAFLWACFLGADVVAYRNANVKVEFVVTTLPATLRRVVEYLVLATITAFAVAMVYYGVHLTMRVTPTFFPALQISQAWMYAALPVSGALMTLHSVRHLLCDRRIAAAEATTAAEPSR